MKQGSSGKLGNAAIVAPSALYGIAGMPLGCYRKSKRKKLYKADGRNENNQGRIFKQN